VNDASGESRIRCHLFVSGRMSEYFLPVGSAVTSKRVLPTGTGTIACYQHWIRRGGPVSRCRRLSGEASP
jgi:hypothetical protein